MVDTSNGTWFGQDESGEEHVGNIPTKRRLKDKHLHGGRQIRCVAGFMGEHTFGEIYTITGIVLRNDKWITHLKVTHDGTGILTLPAYYVITYFAPKCKMTEKDTFSLVMSGDIV